MAVSDAVGRIDRIALNTADLTRAEAFYRQALGFERIGFTRAAGLPQTADSVHLRLGRQIVELCCFEAPGAPYPPAVPGNDLRFQHMAIVVSDMAAAYAQLSQVPGWSAISGAGPVILPESAGGVAAFKFRDPDGHPLELLAFPAAAIPPAWQALSTTGPFLGIDHSAISVVETARSVTFYEGLGFRRSGGSLNRGDEQARLDGLPTPVVEVTALAPEEAPMHLELLCYRAPIPVQGDRMNLADTAATRLVFRVEDAGEPVILLDPDRHVIVMEPA